MAIVIDPGAGALAQAISQAGGDIANGVFAKRIREREIQSDPALMSSLATVARAADKAGTLPQFLSSIGVRPEFGPRIMAGFQAGTAERRDVAGKDTGLPELLAEGDVAEATVRPSVARAAGAVAGITERSANAQGEINLPEQAAFEAFQLSVQGGMTASEAIEQNLPFFDVTAQVAGRQFDANNANFGNDIVNYRRESNADITEINYANMRNQYGIDSTRDVMGVFESLPQGSRERLEMGLAVANPNYLQHRQFHESLDFQSALAEFEAGGRAAESKVALTERLNSVWQTVVDRALEAEEEGTPQGRETAARNLESIRFMIQDANRNGIIFPLDVAQATVEGRKSRIELEQRIFTPNIKGYLSQNGIAGIEDFKMYSDEEAAVITGGMDQRMREDFVAQLSQYNSELTAEENARPGPRTVGGEAVSGTGSYLGRALTSPVTPLGAAAGGYINAAQWGNYWTQQLGTELGELLNTAMMPVDPRAPVAPRPR